jgi:predicted transcriptional regulator
VEVVVNESMWQKHKARCLDFKENPLQRMRNENIRLQKLVNKLQKQITELQLELEEDTVYKETLAKIARDTKTHIDYERREKQRLLLKSFEQWNTITPPTSPNRVEVTAWPVDFDGNGKSLIPEGLI